MRYFDHIALIYNPNSTGDANHMAHELATSIKRHADVIGVDATLTPTEHAMHAHELAREISLTYIHPLIISVSGDGGYNEIINGIMEAKRKAPNIQPVTAVMAAGNANDHKRMTRGETNLLDLITKHEPKPLDLLKLETKDKRLQRYAHSYIGLGISPQVGYELNKYNKNTLVEALILLKTFWKFKPFVIKHDSQTLLLDSIVFANISEMAKVLKLEPETDVTNNRFRVVAFHHRSKVYLLFDVIKALVAHTTSWHHTDRYSFYTTREELVQFDGEVETLPPKSQVTVRSVSGALLSLYDG